MRILVLGAGGIGGYYGGRLVQAGCEVTFLVRPARAAAIGEAGLKIESPLGDAAIKVETVVGGAVGGAYDLVLLSCKAYDLDDAIEAIRPAMGERGVVLPLLNGLAHVAALDEAFGKARVLGGVAHISTTLAPDGTICHLNKLHSLTYGAREPGQDALCDRIAERFAGANFELRRSADILRDLWEKFAFITAAAGITCLMRASVGDIMAARDGERITLAMLEECGAVAAAAGYPVGAKAYGWAKPFLTQPGSDFTASMMRDLEAGARIEADHLQGDMIRRGRAMDVATPTLAIAYCALQAYQSRRSRT